jgi:hypothetical protein
VAGWLMVWAGAVWVKDWLWVQECSSSLYHGL